MQKKSCILCGNSMLQEVHAYVCKECEQVNVEGKYLNNWDL